MPKAARENQSDVGSPLCHISGFSGARGSGLESGSSGPTMPNHWGRKSGYNGRWG